MLVKVLRSTVYPGGTLSVGAEVELPKEEAQTLIAMGKAVEIEERTDVVIDVDDDVDSLEKMTKAELVEHAAEFGIEVPSSWTKAQIIEAIDAEMQAAEEGDIE